MKVYEEKDVPAIYRCPVCRSEHDAPEKAIACANSTPPPKFFPGDVVRVYPDFSWFDGDEAWVVQKGPEKFNGSVLYHFWYVVTKVDLDEGNQFRERRHRQRYHVGSKALQNGMKPFRVGYTFDEGHKDLTLVWRNGKTERGQKRPPEAIVSAIPAMLGTHGPGLL